jgi:hypothetical protein
VVELFYHRMQYFRSEEPGRQKRVEQYPSGWVPPAERAYGPQHNEALPHERSELARKRGFIRKSPAPSEAAED